MGSFVPPGQVTTLHPFVMPQQAVPHNAMPANSHILESHVGHLQSMPRVPSHQYWQNQQVKMALKDTKEVSILLNNIISNITVIIIDADIMASGYKIFHWRRRKAPD